MKVSKKNPQRRPEGRVLDVFDCLTQPKRGKVERFKNGFEVIHPPSLTLGMSKAQKMELRLAAGRLRSKIHP